MALPIHLTAAFRNVVQRRCRFVILLQLPRSVSFPKQEMSLMNPPLTKRSSLAGVRVSNCETEVPIPAVGEEKVRDSANRIQQRKV